MRDHASRVIAAQRSQRSLAAGPAQYLIAAVVTIEEDIVACHGKAECRCAGQEQQQQRVRCNGSQNGCGATATRRPDLRGLFPEDGSDPRVPRMIFRIHPRDPRVRPILGKQTALKPDMRIPGHGPKKIGFFFFKKIGWGSNCSGVVNYV